MSRTDVTPHRWRVATVVGLSAVAIVLVLGWLVLRDQTPGGFGNGFLGGGLLALAAAAFAAWRAARRPDAASTLERAFTQSGDERDDAVLTRALAVLGLCSLPATGIAATAIALGADTAMALALLVFGQIAIVGVAFVVMNRRH